MKTYVKAIALASICGALSIGSAVAQVSEARAKAIADCTAESQKQVPINTAGAADDQQVRARQAAFNACMVKAGQTP